MRLLQLVVTGLLLLLFTASAEAKPYMKGETLRLREYVGRKWNNELIHYKLNFKQGDYPSQDVKLIDADDQEIPVQLSDIETYEDGSLKSARIWLIVTLSPNDLKELRLIPGRTTAKSDLKIKQTEDMLEVTTTFTGARFHLGQSTFDPPIPAEKIPAYISEIRHRSGLWGGRGWFETAHACRQYKVWIMEKGPVFVKVGFEYIFDGFRGQEEDI